MNKQTLIKAQGLVVSAAAFMALTPAVALAEEEERSGISLLIPAIGELIPACVAFAIVFVILSKLVWPAVVKMMSDREEALKVQYGAADEAKAKAAQIVADAEAKAAEVRREAEQVVADAKVQAEHERNRILDEAQAKAADLVDKGRKTVDAERARAMSALSKSVAELSVEIAGRIIAEDLSDEQHLALASRLLDEMGTDDVQ